VASEDEPRSENGRQDGGLPSTARSNGKDAAALAGQPSRKARPAERATRGSREPPVNAVQASRRPRRTRPALQAPAAAAEGAPAQPSSDRTTAATEGFAATLSRADTDPWTVPESVRNRFIQDGHRFFFPDGAPAFKDQGRRLTTQSENTQVVHSLIEIAHSRGWTEVTVTGTERFRQEAWCQARLAGLSVRGYRPSEVEQAQLVRALARNLSRSGERVDSISADALASPPPAPAKGPDPAAREGTRERVVGTLLDHGRDCYRHDPNEEPSYFVRLQTKEGTREILGKDIERAVAKSLTQPQVGDPVILQRAGRDAVTVKRQERRSDGQLTEKNVDVFRNRWVLEKQEFFEERAAAAQLVRNESIAARDAVRQHPELTGTYLNLRAAELASRALRDPDDQRRFVAQVRGALADDVERGEPLQPVRLRDRAARGRTSRLNEEPQPSR
jgi:Large polyvalent protein-associated domain 7